MIWKAHHDSYGRLQQTNKGTRNAIPFRYPGQYEDQETGLHYNRHRYYDPEAGTYLSQDPLGLGGGLRLHGYVQDPNTWVDPLGLVGGCGVIGGEVRLLGPGSAGSVTRNGLSAAEANFAKEIVDFQGGSFIGVARRSAPGIDGLLNGVPASLKATDGGLGAVLRHASRAESSARKAGFANVELFIRAPNVGQAQLLDFARRGPLTAIPNQGTISGINVFTRDGVVRIIGGGL